MRTCLVAVLALGVLAYYLMIWSGHDQSVLWGIYFIISKLMYLLVLIALLSPSRNSETLVYFLIIAALMDIASEFDEKHQQGMYVKYYAHAFGVTVISGLFWAIKQRNLKSIAEKIRSWVKSRSNG